MSDALKTVGLTKEQVMELTGKAPPETVEEADEKKYLEAEDQRRIRRRLKLYAPFIIARYAEGYHPGTIARLMSVSEESIRSRLRRAGVFNASGPGRPPSSDQKAIQK